MKIKFFIAMLSLFVFVQGNGQTNMISDSLDVIKYDIHLNMVNLSTKRLAGYADLLITPKHNGLSKIELQLLKLNCDSVFVEQVKTNNFSYNDTLITVSLPIPMQMQDTIPLRIYYHGVPQVDATGWGGFYFTSDSSFAYNLGVGFGASPHSYGRVWFPCVDEFPEKALYDYYITVKNDKMAVCGGTLMGVVINANTTKTYHWKLHDPIPSYLSSVAVGNYVCVSDTFQGIEKKVPINIYVPPTYVPNVNGSFSNLKNILGIYENRFGPYKWERVGYVGVPFNNGAMEHSTNIAYPLSCITGNNTYEMLYAHELSHQWFGDLVTCSTEADMWFNEGWASYCEAIAVEGLYGNKAYKDYVRNNHLSVVQAAHVQDDGYLAVYGTPSAYTYGTTVYDKGADIVHTLRHYMGDGGFFNSVKSLMNQKAYQDISTLELQNFLSVSSGVSVTDFFNAWILQPGFPHFSIDSMKITALSPQVKACIWVRQRLNHANNLALSNKLEITFANQQWQFYTDTIQFSGEFGSKEFVLPFAPTFAMMDFNEKTSDAITDMYWTIKSITNISNTPALCNLSVTSVADSAFVRVEHNWVAPDPLKIPNPDIYRLSDYHYWKVDGIFPAGFVTKAKFRYNRLVNASTGNLDNVLMPSTNSADSLLLLYRWQVSDDWKIVPFTRSGGATNGYLVTDTLQSGEYTLAIGKPYYAGINTSTKEDSRFHVFPNPSNKQFTFTFSIKSDGYIIIYNSLGILVDSIPVNSSDTAVSWNCKAKSTGNYVAKLMINHQALATQKICVIK